jgi:hypothetical protein
LVPNGFDFRNRLFVSGGVLTLAAIHALQLIAINRQIVTMA